MQRVISFYYFIYFVAMAATSPFLSLYLSQKGVNDTHIGLLLAAGSAASIFAQPILGFMNDQAKDPRRLLLYSAVLSPIVFAGYAVVHSFWLLLAVSLVLTIVQSASPIMDAIAVAEANREGFTYGQIRLWGALGFALTTVVAGYLYHSVGLQAAFVTYGMLSVILIGANFFLPKRPQLASAREKLFGGIWKIARDKKMMTFIVICFVMSTANAVNYNFLPLYFQDLHYPMAWVGLNFTIAALVEVPFFYVSGRVLARYGLMPTILAASLLYTLKFAVMATAPGPVTVIAIQVLEGIAFALYWSASVQTVSALSPPDRAATAQTLFGAFAGSLSNIAGTVGGGWILGHLGPLWMYACNAGLGMTAFVSFFLFSRISKFRLTTRDTTVETL